MRECDAVPLDPTRRSEDADLLDRELRNKIIGQDSAVEAIVDLYQVFLAGLNPPGRPVGTLLFLGPTGSGKTRVVEAMAETLFGDPRACIKIDCAEFQHSHEIAKLVGSPPGYLGHRETHPVLTQEALMQWQTDRLKMTILMFDEIEKASDALWKLLLGILDKATLTLGDNRRVDLSQCVIIMTSNLGTQEMSILTDGGLGFQPTKADAEITDSKISKIATGAAKRKFDPEFMNRIDKSVVFKTLQPEHLQKILEIELGLAQKRVAMSPTNPFVFSCTTKFKDFLLEEGFNPKYGARHLKRAVEKHLVAPISKIMSTGQVEIGDYVKIDIGSDGTTLFTKEGQGALIPYVKPKAMAANSVESRRAELAPERQEYPIVDPEPGNE